MTDTLDITYLQYYYTGHKPHHHNSKKSRASVDSSNAIHITEYSDKDINPYPTAFPYGNGMVLHFYQQQESSTTKTVHKVLNKGLKTYVYSPHTGENLH